MIHVLPLLVKDLMCRDAVTIGGHYTVREVARIMVDFKIDALMVIEKNEILGILTIRSILNSTLDGYSTDEISVGDLVKDQSLIFVRPNTSLDQAATLMKENDIKILPVVSNDLEGFLYYEDLAEQRPELFTKRNPPNSTINYII